MALFRTLIAAKNADFRYHFSPPPETLNFTHNIGSSQPRLAGENGAILETSELPATFLKIWENPSAQFVSCVMVWADGVNVAGSSPTGGILEQLRECVNV